MEYEVKKEFKNIGAKVQVNLPASRIEAMANIPRRFTVMLDMASQDQLRLLYHLKHPGITEIAKKATK